MSYLNPTAAEVRRNRLIVGSLALLATLTIAAAFLVGRKYPDRVPTIIYVQSWAATRTREDTLQDRAREQAELAARLKASRDYIATLPPDKRKIAQGEYDRYVAAKPHERDN